MNDEPGLPSPLSIKGHLEDSLRSGKARKKKGDCSIFFNESHLFSDIVSVGPISGSQLIFISS